MMTTIETALDELTSKMRAELLYVNEAAVLLNHMRETRRAAHDLLNRMIEEGKGDA